MKSKLAVFLLCLSLSACSCPGKYILSHGNMKITFECSETSQITKTGVQDEPTTF